MTKFSAVEAMELLTCLSNIHGLSSASIGDACASLLIGRGMDIGMELVCRGFQLLWGMSHGKGRSDVSKLSIVFSHSTKLEDLVFIGLIGGWYGAVRGIDGFQDIVADTSLNLLSINSCIGGDDSRVGGCGSSCKSCINEKRFELSDVCVDKHLALLEMFKFLS
jgi:hypothetical protein